MAELPKYRAKERAKENNNSSIVKLFQFLSSKGFKIVPVHESLFPQRGDTTERKEDICEDVRYSGLVKQLLSIPEASRYKNVDVLQIAKLYVHQREMSSKKTPLHFCAEIGDTELVDVFIRAGADTNAVDLNNQTALHLSIIGGHRKAVELLLRASADLNVADICKQTALHVSAELGYLKITEILLNAGANFSACNKNKQTALHLCAKNGQIEIIKLLLKAGAAVNAEDFYKQTPLHLSSEAGDRDIVVTLLKHGASVNSVDWNRHNALHFSSKNNQTEVVKVLLKAGSLVDAQDSFQNTSLHFSAMNGGKKLVKLLIDAGADVNIKANFRQSALHLSAANGHKEIVRLLLEAGAIVDAEDINKQTPLHLSAERGHAEIYRILLRAGASFRKSDIYGYSAMSYMDGFMATIKAASMVPGIQAVQHSKTTTVKRGQRPSSVQAETKHTETLLARFENTFTTARNREPRPHSPATGKHIPTKDPDPFHLKNIKEQIESHWSKFQLKPKKGWESSTSAEVCVEITDDRTINAPTTINIMNVKQKNIIYHCDSGSQLNISNPDIVSVNGRIDIHNPSASDSRSEVDDESDADSNDKSETNV